LRGPSRLRRQPRRYAAPRSMPSRVRSTLRWREQDSNPRSPRHGELCCASRHSTSRAWGTGSGGPGDRAFCRSAAHSTEPGAHTVLTGGGLRHCSSSCGCGSYVHYRLLIGKKVVTPRTRVRASSSGAPGFPLRGSTVSNVP